MVDASPIWTTPVEQVTGTVITKAIWDEQLAQNLAALKARPGDQYEADEVSDYSTASGSFVNIDGTNLLFTITTTGGVVEVHFHGNFFHDTALAYGYLEVDIDSGTPLIGDDGLGFRLVATTDWPLISFTRRVTGLSAAVHTFALQWKTSAGNLGLSAGAGTTDRDTHPQFWVEER